MCILKDNISGGYEAFKEGHEFAVTTIGELNIITSKLVNRINELKNLNKDIERVKDNFLEESIVKTKHITKEKLQKLSSSELFKMSSNIIDKENDSEDSKKSLDVEMNILEAFDRTSSNENDDIKNNSIRFKKNKKKKETKKSNFVNFSSVNNKIEDIKIESKVNDFELIPQDPSHIQVYP